MSKKRNVIKSKFKLGTIHYSAGVLSKITKEELWACLKDHALCKWSEEMDREQKDEANFCFREHFNIISYWRSNDGIPFLITSIRGKCTLVHFYSERFLLEKY